MKDEKPVLEHLKDGEIISTSRRFALSIVSGSSHLFRRASSLIADARVIDSSTEVAVPAPGRFSNMSGYFITFIFFVAIPAIASILYLAFIASNQYVSETRFAVRTSYVDFARDKNTGALTSVSSGAVPALAGQDAYIVSDYVRSRAIIDTLLPEIDLRAIFRRPGADFWMRLKKDASIEELVDYWRGMVTTYVDGPSGVVTIQARTFFPEDALVLSRAIIKASEAMVNGVSERARRDSLKRGEDEVRRSETAMREALQDLRNFRDKEGFIDPVVAATSTSQLLLQTMSEKIRLENDYFVAASAMSAQAPTVQALKERIDGLDMQITTLRAQLTGDAAQRSTISASIVKYEELELKRIFSEKMLSLSQESLERARLKAVNQSIYISVFVPPGLPEYSKYPERLSLSFIIPITLLILWGIMALVAAAVDDHRT